MSSNLRVVELDFDQIKENLKNFLRGQDYFTDYDFDGSAMSIILDMLAYDTHYKAYLANMVINERFIDTSVKRASVISHAKTLGFVPRSAKAAKAIIDVTIFGISTDYTLTMDKYTPFSCNINGVDRTFVNLIPYTTTPSGAYNNYKFSNVELYEGNPVAYSYTATSNVNQRFKIPAENVDTSTLSVYIQTSLTDTTLQHYSYASAISVVGPTDLVYYLEEGNDGFFYVYFGDGVLGKPLAAGNLVKMEYIVTSGSASNTSQKYSQSFNLAGFIGNYNGSHAVVELKASSEGGEDKQGTEEVRFLAPKNYATQGRTVTTEDYKTLLLHNFPEIDSITVWGGENNTPPIYGKVFISIKPKNGFVLSDSTKDYIRQYLKENSVVSVQSEFVDPDFTFITVSCNVKYDSNVTYKTSSDIAQLAKSVIQTYFQSSLQKFSKTLYISRLQSAIDRVDPSILGNTVTLNLQKRFEPVLGLNASYSLYFNNKLNPYSIQSSAFRHVYSDVTYIAAIKDVPNDTPPNKDGSGVLVLYDTTNQKVINPALGTINYATGLVSINALTVTGYPSPAMYDVRIKGTPQEQIDEITGSIAPQSSISAYIPEAMKNQILMLDDSTMIPDYFVANGLSVTANPA